MSQASQRFDSFRASFVLIVFLLHPAGTAIAIGFPGSWFLMTLGCNLHKNLHGAHLFPASTYRRRDALQTTAELKPDISRRFLSSRPRS
ncbi:hypothetical protein C8J56DRAFT_908969 [Mycena floridula]|nr:hypothetical protein C8J56DRAFT_908969 [Mycena floridula]